MYTKRYYIRYKITDNVLKLDIDGNSLTLRPAAFFFSPPPPSRADTTNLPPKRRTGRAPPPTPYRPPNGRLPSEQPQGYAG